MQILVAFSALGSLHCNIFSSSRIFFVGARNGHLPGALALISLGNLTPVTAIMFIVRMSKCLSVYHFLTLNSFILGRISYLDVNGRRRLRPHQLRHVHRFSISISYRLRLVVA